MEVSKWQPTKGETIAPLDTRHNILRDVRKLQMDPRTERPDDKSSDRRQKNTDKINVEKDIRDSDRDEERLKADNATIDLPDVSDIPGQENVHVPPLGELADTTISSDDEEGKGVFDADQEEGPVNTTDRGKNDDE